jgi:hypothetical protein
MIKVGICQPIHVDQDLPQITPALGHLTNGLVKIPSQLQYPTFCAHTNDVANAGSWRGGFRNVATRLAYLTRRAIGIQPLYAVHGGLGGLGKGLSPFGGVDLTVFQASLSGQTVGLPPSADAALWTYAERTGTITVQPSLGGYTDTLIVITQTGGSCSACGRPFLKANLFDASLGGGATNGIYEVSWVSLQNSPSAIGPPFSLRGNDLREIARLNYAQAGGQKRLRYNEVNVGSWVAGVPQRFVITVNLDTKKTSLSIDGVEVASDVPFFKAATSLADLTVEMTGQAGVVGWAEISVKRLEDE